MIYMPRCHMIDTGAGKPVPHFVFPGCTSYEPGAPGSGLSFEAPAAQVADLLWKSDGYYIEVNGSGWMTNYASFVLSGAAFATSGPFPETGTRGILTALETPTANGYLGKNEEEAGYSSWIVEAGDGLTVNDPEDEIDDESAIAMISFWIFPCDQTMVKHLKGTAKFSPNIWVAVTVSWPGIEDFLKTYWCGSFQSDPSVVCGTLTAGQMTGKMVTLAGNVADGDQMNAAISPNAEFSSWE